MVDLFKQADKYSMLEDGVRAASQQVLVTNRLTKNNEAGSSKPSNQLREEVRLTLRKLDGPKFGWHCTNGYDLVGYVDSSFPCAPTIIQATPTSPFEQNSTYELWMRQDHLLYLAIIRSSYPNIVPLIMGTKSSTEAWSCLKRTYVNASRSRILDMKTTLAKTNMGTMSISEYLITIKHMVDELALIGASLSEDEILLHVLNGPSPYYKEVGVVMRVRDTLISFEELHNKLIEHEIYLKRDMERKESFNATAQYN
eukprot:XP_010648826.1 PREDICTED: uncharacterized protein LOC104879059 [Vitis vinifera]